MGNVYVTVLDHTAWLIGESGALFALDVERLEVKHFRRADELLPTGLRTGQAVVVPDPGAPEAADPRSLGGVPAAEGRFYWVMPADEQGRGGAVHVFDLQEGRAVRRIPDVIRIGALPGVPGARVACYKLGRPNEPATATLHEARGPAAPGGRVAPHPHAPVMIAVHPSGEGLVVLVGGSNDGQRIKLLHVSPGERPKAPSTVPAQSTGTPMGLASSVEAGLCVVSMAREDLRWVVLVTRPTGHGFDLVHETEAPSRTTLVRDASARAVVAYSADPPGLALMGLTAPDLPSPTTREATWIYDLTDAPGCLDRAAVAAPAEPMPESPKLQIRGGVATVPLADVDMWIRQVRREDGVGGTFHGVQADQWRALLIQRHLDLPQVRLLSADDHARHGRWQEVRAVLAPSSAESFPDEEGAQHFYHMHALASLHLGDASEARRWLAAARGLQGSCSLDAISAVLVPKPDPQEPVPEETAAPLRLTQLVWAVEDADARLAAEDPEGALAALDPRRFDTGDELQVLARQVEAWLRVTPPPGAPRFVKIMTLARFVQAHAEPPYAPRTELPLSGTRWDQTRLDDLARRASTWLEAQPETPSPPR
jgi:hypothetical protein